MARRLAFLFPGQGQLPTDIPPLDTELENLYERAEAEGLSVREWVRRGDTERLSHTDAAQPTVFLDSLSRAELLRARGLEPAVVAGHSLGEYAALVSAGVLPAETALSLVIRRGYLMAGVSGGMTAVLKLDLAAVSQLCAAVGRDATIANYNGARQFVVAGPLETLDDLERGAAAAGGRALRLAVSGPFHSPLMEPAQAALAPAIAASRFSSPRRTFVSSVTGRTEDDTQTLRALLARQITSSVRWTDVVASLSALGVTDAIEVGPGTVLTQLGKRASEEIRFQSFEEAFHAWI
jgi:[acyl-carrier-protein] S-malonyltransferase